MRWKHALLASFIFHSILFIFLLAGKNWTWYTSKKPLPPIEAHLVIKSKNKNKELLPRKVKAPPENQGISEAKKEPEKKEPAPKPLEDKKIPENDTTEKLAAHKEPKKAPESKPSKGKEDSRFLSKLSSLSQAFAKELETKEVVEPEGELVDDSSYFDQIYTLIKSSFVVPPHLDGPTGHNLQAVVRLFLSSNGDLNKLELEVPSGDEHFDRAVMDGTKRVNNFGAVPIFLQNVLREKGIVVELCPVKCKER